MERLLAGELDHLTELLKLRGAVTDEYMAAFLDGIIRGGIPQGEAPGSAQDARPPARRRRLGAGARRWIGSTQYRTHSYEAHMSLVKSLRASAETQLELEVIAAMEKSIERTHLMLRMLINALTELPKAAQRAEGR
jgi:hypothetical protein